MESNARDAVLGAVDIGGTKISVALATEAGILDRRDTSTQALGGALRGVPAIADMLRELVAKAGRPLQGIGIGCTGPVNPLTGVIERVGNLQGWEDCPLVEALAQAFDVPVALENDADAAALAEYRWGSGKGIARFLYITASTGIGGGLVLNGSLYRGHDGSHPEMGHQTLDPNGPLCYCGAHGCWESLASGLGLTAWFRANDPEGRDLEAKKIFALHDAGDHLAIAAIERLAFYTGLGLANLTTMLVPDVIALGGGLCARADAFLPTAIASMRRLCGEVPAEHTHVRLAQLGSDTALRGAAAVWLSRNASALTL